MAAIETEHNDYECDKKTSPKSDFIKMGHKTKVLDQIELDQNLFLSRDTKIATKIQNPAVDKSKPVQGNKTLFLSENTKTVMEMQYPKINLRELKQGNEALVSSKDTKTTTEVQYPESNPIELEKGNEVQVSNQTRIQGSKTLASSENNTAKIQYQCNTNISPWSDSIKVESDEILSSKSPSGGSRDTNTTTNIKFPKWNSMKFEQNSEMLNGTMQRLVPE